MNKKKRFITIVTLGLLSAMGALSTDMYLPGFPDIARELGTTVEHITLSITSFFIGISAGQIIYGPLLDRFGRKIPLYIGLIVYILTSIACALVPTADMLIGIRFLQALGSCAGLVASRALVRDLFPVNENAKIFSLLVLVLAVSPIIAPTAGGYLTAIYGWESVFYVLTGIAVLTLGLVYFYLPSGRAPEKDLSLKPLPILNSFRSVAANPQFYTYAISGALAASGLYAYIAGSPAVFMQLYRVSEQHYGWIFGFNAVGLILASQVNNLLLRRYSSEQIIRVTLFCQSITGIIFLACALLHLLDLYMTIGFIWVFLATQGFAFPNSSALCLAPFSHNAGTASALMGAIQLGMGAIATALVSYFSNGTVIPMSGVMCACAISGFLILLIGSRRITELPEEMSQNHAVSED